MKLVPGTELHSLKFIDSEHSMRWRLSFIVAMAGLLSGVGQAVAQTTIVAHTPEVGREEAVNMIRQLHGKFKLGPFKIANPIGVVTSGNNSQNVPTQQIYPMFDVYLQNTGLTDAGAILLSGLTYLQGLYVSHTRITDEGLVNALTLTVTGGNNNTSTGDLRRLFTARNEVGGTIIAIIWEDLLATDFLELRELDVSFTSVDDIDMILLSGFPELRKLWLTGSQVTDLSIPLIASNPKLQVVYLGQTQITSAGIQSLRTLAPGLTIVRGIAPPGSLNRP
jgi:Leucine-rich repeat (LRR) protein